MNKTFIVETQTALSTSAVTTTTHADHLASTCPSRSAPRLFLNGCLGRPRRAVLAATALALASAASTPAGQIGLKLGLNGNGNIQSAVTTAGALRAGDLAGAPGYAQTNWNNLGRWGNLNQVVDQNGTNSGVYVQWDASAIYSAVGGGTPTAYTNQPDNQLMNGYDDSNGNANTYANDGTITTGVSIFGNSNNKPWMYVTNLSAWLASQGACSYDVVIYAEGDAPNRIGQYWVEAASGVATAMTIGPNLTPSIYIRGQSAFVPNNNSYAQVPTASSTGAAAQSGNFAVFPGLSDNVILIRTEEYRPPGGTLRSPINAIQLIPRFADVPSFPYPLPATPQTNYGGANTAFLIPASGCVSYQWKAGAVSSGVYTNLSDGGNVWGTKTPLLTITNMLPAQTADYILEVSNSFGTLDSTPTTLVVQPAIITGPVASEILYPGGTANFFATPTGTGTLTNRWVKNGVPLSDGPTGTGSTVSGSTTTNLVVSNVSASDQGNYALVVSTAYGSQTSTACSVTVLPAPPSGSFAECAMTNKALAYWRLGEASGPVAYDYAGGFNGTYLASSQPGQAGPQPTDFPGFEGDNASVGVNPSGITADQSWVTIPALYLNTNTVTIVAWLNPAYAQANWAGILTCRHGGTQAGFNFSDTKNELVYTWNQNTTYQYHSGLIASTNVWTMVALVVSPTNAAFYAGDSLFGLRSAVITLNNNNELWSGTATIGEDDTFGAARAFTGFVDEVAVFKRSLTTDDINRLWYAGRTQGVVPAPTILQSPTPVVLYPGRTANFSVLTSGLLQKYQWRTNGVNLTDGGRVSGSTTPRLTLTGVQASDAVNYDVIVYNTGGSVTSSVATLTLTAPTGAAYEAAVMAAAPYAYWRLNENSVNPYAYDYYGGITATYGEVAQILGEGSTGPASPAFPGMESANTGLLLYNMTPTSWVAVPPLNLNTNAVTFAAWINPGSDQTTNFAGLVYQRQGLTVAGLAYGATANHLGYNWNNSAAAYNWDSGLVVPVGQWSFAAVVVESNRATLYLYNTDTQTVAAHLLNHPVQPFAGTTYIGADPFYASGERIFNGTIDEVSIWKRALSGEQLTALFTAASGITMRPTIALQPSPLTVYSGMTAKFDMTAAGSGPLTYRWYKNGTNALSDAGAISGSGSATLTVSNAALSDIGTYSVVVGNSLGSVTSSVVTLTVFNSNAQPVFAAPAAISINSLTNQTGFLVGAASFGATEYIVNVTNGATVLSYDFKVDGSMATATGAGTMTGAYGPALVSPSYSNTTGNATFDSVLGEASYDGGPKTITIKGLIPGRAYTLQLISLDDRDSSGGLHREQSRRAYFQDPYNATNVSTTFYMSNNYYVKVSFTAASTSQVLYEQLPGWPDGTTDLNTGNLQAAILRDSSGLPGVSQQPASATRYVGFPVSFTAGAYGVAPVSYQWQRGSGGAFTNLPNSGTFSAQGFTNLTLSIPAVSLADALDYRLVLTNSSGAYTSQVATLTVITAPVGSWERGALSYGPLAYWRLDEAAGTAIAYDYAGGFDATVGAAVTNGVAGPPNPPFVGFEPGDLGIRIAGNVANSWDTVPALNLNTNTATFTAWLYPIGSQASWSGVLMTRAGSTQAGIGYNDQQMLGYTWNGNSTWSFVSGLVIPSDQWSFVAVTISPTNAALYLINTSGLQSTNNAIAHNVEVWNGVSRIGNDANTAPGRNFNGVIDDVVVYPRTLSPADIQNLYAAVPLAPPATAPTGLTATPGDAQVGLSWNAVAGATGYNVKQSTQSGGPYTTVTTAGGLTYNRTGLSNGTNYYFVVSAVNPAGESANSAEASARPVSLAPPQITSGVNAKQLQLSWPADHLGWRLLVQTNTAAVGISTNWVTVPGSSSVTSFAAPIDPANGCVFYRLVYP